MLLAHVIALPVLPRKVRWLMLRASGVRTKAWNIGACRFTGPRVTVGRGTYINRGCTFDSWEPITIGERCAIGLEVAFITSTHAIGDHSQRAGDLGGKGIQVGDGCWIGSRATILPGVTIGDGAVIAAGAVVTRDCEPDELYAGVPARRIRSLE